MADGAKNKLEVLDALRGLCALVVVLLHLTEMTPCHVVPHGYLPVAYFFLLTGFMFSYAYDGRWKTMSLGRFFRRRLLRLHPLVIVGSLVALVAIALAPERIAKFGADGVPSLPLIFLYSCTLLPAPATWGCIHVLQGQLWTLQYIYLANIVYALVLRHLKTWMLAVLALAGAVFAVKISLAHGGLEYGWQLEPDHVTIAFARMCFPVVAGMLIARTGWKIRTGNFALPLTAALLLATCFAPHFGDRVTSGIFDAAVSIALMPLVLMLAVGGTITNARTAAVCRFLGKYSFPLYVTHFQFRVTMMHWMDSTPDVPVSQHVALVVATAVVMFVFAWAAMKAADSFDAWIKERNGRVAK